MSTRWLTLGKNISIAVSKTHTFGTDAVLLAHFSAPRNGDSACDLGTGCGIIPLLWARDELAISVMGIDCQDDAIALANESLSHLHTPTSLHFITADFREWTTNQAFSLIVSNPPYFPENESRNAHSTERNMARRDGIGCTFADICQTAARLLDDHGRFCFCHRPEYVEKLVAQLKESGLYLQKTVTVFHDESKAPFLWLCEATKTPSETYSCTNWILHENGEPSPLYKQIYAPFFEENSL